MPYGMNFVTSTGLPYPLYAMALGSPHVWIVGDDTRHGGP